MDKARVPEWIRKLKQEHELSAARRDTARRQQVENSVLLQREGPTFWNRLQESLSLAVDSLPLLKISGSISRFAEGIRIEVAYQHLVPIHTYTDISYDPAKAIVRCATINGGIGQLYLCVTDNNEIAASAELDGSPMNPEQAAEFIVRPMVDYVYIQQ